MFTKNLLLYGDNLAFLSDPREFPDESVDLIYLDPPFNSNATYNVLFREASGEPASAQIKAFDDTWRWDESAANALATIQADSYASNDVKSLIGTFHGFLGHSPMLAYLVQMAARLVHMRRVLTPTGSLYLHCDPTASHYLKLILDGVFGPTMFRSEIIWQRTNSRSTSGKWPRLHDILLHYAKSAQTGFSPIKVLASEAKMPHTLITWKDGRKYQTYELTAPGLTKEGESGKPWRGFDPSSMGRHWANNHATMDAWDADELIHWARNNGFPRRRDSKPFEPENRFVTVGDVWTDVDRINQTAKERLGYPTQKPLELLRRVVLASSKPGDVVLDPFCGCGTLIDAVETVNREHPHDEPRIWIGIDVTHLAVNLIKSRLTRFDPPPNYVVRGEPVTVSGAIELFKTDAYQFQFWACGLVGARPAGASGPGSSNGKQGKKGADRGIDGLRFFTDSKPRTILVQVKGGKAGAKEIRDFRGTIEREDAALGIFITLQEPTRPMREEAAAAGVYEVVDERVPRLQIVTIETLLSGGTPSMPAGVQLPSYAVFDKTVKKAQAHDTRTLFSGE